MLTVILILLAVNLAVCLFNLSGTGYILARVFALQEQQSGTFTEIQHQARVTRKALVQLLDPPEQTEEQKTLNAIVNSPAFKEAVEADARATKAFKSGICRTSGTARRGNIMKLVCMECEPQTIEEAPEVSIKLPDGSKIVTAPAEKFYMPRRLREVASMNNGIATLAPCGHKRLARFLSFAGEQA